MKMKTIETLAFKYIPKKEFLILDQTFLPEKEIWISINTPEDMAQSIKSLKIRGANIIGITAALSLAQSLLKGVDEKTLKRQSVLLKKARPTAVHLVKAVSRVMTQNSKEKQIQEAINIYEEDKIACKQISQLGQSIIEKKDRILTYCNTGSLATGGLGTALGIIKQSHKNQKDIFVYACETRPVNQGSRLTFWELQKNQIPSTLLCDNMVGSLMAESKIQKIIVGADRISTNYDVANKIGTLNLAIIANYFKIPFYIAAPSSTFDKNICQGKDIPIEQRNPQEISHFWSKKASLYNPAFDVTPFSLITGIITEKEIIKNKNGYEILDS